VSARSAFFDFGEKMKKLDPSIVGGLILILAGGLFLLQTLGYLDNVGDVFWGALFLAAGLLFLFAFVTGSWWGAIPGCILAGIGALILLPDSLDLYGGALFLGSISLAFWLVFLTAPRERWWALIPAGVLTTLAVVTFLPDMIGDMATGGIFFFGLALTFLLVALLTGMRWAYYPAAALALVGLLAVFSLGAISNYAWAVVLIGGGGYLVYRALRPSSRP
jgi:hypothetical protein